MNKDTIISDLQWIVSNSDISSTRKFSNRKNNNAEN